jgi:hypothetical protein
MLHADASQVEQIALRVCDKKHGIWRPFIGSCGSSCQLEAVAVLGHVGALIAVAAAMRRLVEVDPAAFGGNPRCVDHKQQVPPRWCDGRGRWHLKEHCLGAGHLNREVH